MFKGELLNVYDLEREEIYKNFSDYFENPTMIKLKDNDSLSLYYCKINTSLIIEYRYIIAMVKKNNHNIGDSRKLKDLKWETLQCRNLQEDHDLPLHSYTPRRFKNLDKKIFLKEKTDSYHRYECDQIKINIFLLNKKKSQYYNETGSVISCIETFETIINFI